MKINELLAEIASHLSSSYKGFCEVQLREDKVVIIMQDGSRYQINAGQTRSPRAFDPLEDFRNAPTVMSNLTPCSLHKGFKEDCGCP